MLETLADDHYKYGAAALTNLITTKLPGLDSLSEVNIPINIIYQPHLDIQLT